MKRFSQKNSWYLPESELIISSDQPQEAVKNNDFSPHCTVGETEVDRDRLTRPRSENSSGTELGDNPRSSLQGPPGRPVSRGGLLRPRTCPAGARRLVCFGAEAHVITSWIHRMLKQMGPETSSDLSSLFYEGGN